MSKIKLTMQERFGIRNLLNEVYQKGGMDLPMVMTSTRLLDKTVVEAEFSKKEVDGVFKAIKNDEAVRIGLTVDKAGTMRWNSKEDNGVEVEVSNKEYDLIASIIRSKSEKKELKLTDGYLVGMAEKFGIKTE